jgi:glycine/D-amino acid oxidase-like deaminating enzyme
MSADVLAYEPEEGPPLWRMVNAPGPAGERLSGVIEMEFAIVGAGMAGLSTALHLAQMGKEVVVVDAVQAHLDGASASAGIIAPQLVRNTPASVLRKLGQAQGSALLRMIAESGRHAFGLAADHQIDCFAQTAGFLAPAPTGKGLGPMREIVGQWAPFRSDLKVLDARQIEALSGCVGYDGALLDESGGGLDPVALLLGLERAAKALGVRIYRNSPASRVSAHSHGWEVSTPGGAVRAKRVLLCANGGNAGLDPRLSGSVLPLPVYEVATFPLAPDMRRVILPEGHTLTDTATDVLSLRFDRDGRLITALAAARRLSAAELERAVNDRLERALPGYRRTPLEFAWRGTAWLNSSLLPRAVILDPGLTAVQACNGRGLGVNLIAGRELARWLANPGALPLLPLSKPAPVPAFALMKYVPRLMMAGSALANRVARPLSARRDGP